MRSRRTKGGYALYAAGKGGRSAWVGQVTVAGDEASRNVRLEDAVRESGLSLRQLAAWVCRLGESRGVHLGTTHTTVTRWIAGVQPRWPVSKLVADALSLRLGFPVTPGDLGFADHVPTTQSVRSGLEVPWTVEDASETTADLTYRDMKRRNFLMGASFAPSAYAQPALLWATATIQERVARPIGGVRVGVEDAERILAKVAMFRHIDYEMGGHETRELVVNYLHTVVQSKLKGTYDEPSGVALHRAVAQLAEHAAWTSFDSGRDALAQRYFIRALRFAQAGGDHTYGAHIIASMACQAAHLRLGREAINLARIALQRVEKHAMPRLLALLHLMEARGHAVLQDEAACTQSLNQAEHVLERARPGSDPLWIDFFVDATLAHWFAQCYLDLGNPHMTERFASEALSLRAGTGPLCRRVQEMTFIAIAQLHSGNLDLACATGSGALKEAQRLSSPYTLGFLSRLRDRVGSHRDDANARDFDEASSALLNNASGYGP